MSAACFTCRSGNAALHSARLRPSVGALWPVHIHAYGRLCLAVRNTFSPKFNLTSHLYVSNTVSLGLTAYLIQQEVKNDKMYI